MQNLLTSQLTAEATTTAVFVASLLLAIIISKRYTEKRSRSLLFWSAGMWFFAIGVLLEVVFAVGVYSELMINAYLFIVALIVEALALGSMQLVNSNRIKNAYYAFTAITAIFLLYSLMSAPTGNLIRNYVVMGIPPLLVIIASSLITFPAAAVLVAVAYLGYRKSKNPRLLSIIAGVAVVSIAGTLYIVQYPAFLYVAEVIGIALLWYGFL